MLWKDLLKPALPQERKQAIKDNLFKFKMRLLRVNPFYGDVLLKLPVIEDETISTACTDGKAIRYNPRFFDSKTEEECNFILLHEVLHVLLMHCTRRGIKDPEIWNVACDFMVNNMIMIMQNDLKHKGIELKVPDDALEASWFYVANKSTEELYEQLCRDNYNRPKGHKAVYVDGRGSLNRSISIPRLPGDVILADNLTNEERNQLEDTIRGYIREAAKLCSGPGSGSFSVPEQFLRLAESRKISWKTLLRDFLAEGDSEESSYFTPERKYLHMDLIIPGPGERSEELGEVWAFIDDSGSIGPDDLNQFLTQLYRIMKEFHGTMNVAFWNTKVDSVYKGISTQKELLAVAPKGTGGTDASCVYRYLKENRIHPEVMLLLTDGEFGAVPENLLTRDLRKRTIVVLDRSGFFDTSAAESLGKVTNL
jgi:predicted metal-dependent peptidase